MDSPTALQEFLEYVVAQLIKHHDHASVVHEIDNDRHIYRVLLHPDDVGKIIGKNGYTVSAIRSLMNAAGAKTNTRTVLKVDARELPGTSPQAT